MDQVIKMTIGIRVQIISRLLYRLDRPDGWGPDHRHLLLLHLMQVIYEKLDGAQKEAFLDIAAFCRFWDWRTVERIVGKAQLDTLVDLGLVHAKLRDIDSFSGIAHLTRYSEQPWRTDMVMMHDLLYAIACRRAQNNRVHSEDQTHLPDRLVMDSPGMVSKLTLEGPRG